nr:MAG TPA: Type I restriction enzyme Methylase [Caudoviricetes sp.]
MLYNGNNDFYPTPAHLARKMLDKVKFEEVSTILEPSAGKGDLIEMVKQKECGLYGYKFDIDAIEKDANLRHILNGKEYRTVHDDFLTYETFKQYDLIIMNPPFSDGCKHILKALEMQKRNGGQIVCLLNAETIKNPFSNDRMALQRELTELNADIDFLSDEFIDAERKTAVEVALIYVNIPKTEKESFILEGLRQSEKYAESENTNITDLAEGDYLKRIVKQYQMEVEAGIKLINEYKAMQPYIMQDFEKEGKSNVSYNRCILGLKVESKKRLSINDFVKEVRGKYWRALFKNPDFVGLLTANLQTDLQNRINELRDYDFSMFNIMTLKVQMSNELVKGVEDTILNLFEELGNKYHYYDETSKNIHYYNGWKTNKAWKINKKVIIPLTGYGYWGDRYKPTHYQTLDKLQDIEKCFNYLDGGLTDAVDLKQSLKFAEQYGETKNIQLKYFTVTFYKKGTCHIVFNNDELLKKFNIFGSQKKGWLPPSYGKKQYKDMTTEEKTVVNEFDGNETEYNKTMKNRKYYLFDSNSVLMLENKAV